MNTGTSVILLLVASFFAIVFRKNKHQMDKRGKKGGLRYHFLKNSLEFLIPLILVLAFYLTLLIVVSISMDYATLSRLIQMEETLLHVKSWVSLFNLGAIGVVIGFAALYIVGLLRIPFEKQLSKGYDWFLKASKRLYLILVLLCSFTLLGTQTGELVTNIELRIKTIHQGYADLCKQTQAALSGEVAANLYDKVHKSLPPDYIAALELPEKIDGQATAFRELYQKAQREYRISNQRAESLIAEADLRNKSVSALQSEYDVTDETIKVKFTEPDPNRISYKKIENAKNALTQYQQNRESKIITFLKAESGKKLTMKLPKIITSQLKSQIFSSWIESRPIAGPIIDVFFGTLDNQVEEQIGKAVDKAVSAAIEDPTKGQKAVEEESSKIVGRKDVKMSQQVIESASKWSRQLHKELDDIQETRSRVESEIKTAEQKKIDNLIAELGSSNEDVRERAATSLSGMGDKISKSQVEQLERIMKNGDKNWSKFLYRQEGHHCSWYEKTSIKYYAANAVEKMNSPYVSRGMVTEANNYKRNSKTKERVTDPGWV